MNKRTAREYYLILLGFQEFVNNRYGTKNQTEVTLDDIIANIKEDSEDVYEILSDFVSHLQTKYDISALTLKQKVVTVKNFFEYCDVDVSPRKFKLKVKLPRVIRKNKQALSKEDIIDILNSCYDNRLKTYVMLLAATEMRATEALFIRIKDLDFDSNPDKVLVRGEYTNTKSDR